MIESLRIGITRIFAVALIFLLMISSGVLNRKAPVVSDLFFFVGLVMTGVGVLGRLWCSLFIAGYKTDRLIVQGPYSLCRNPLYFFSFIGAMGIGLATGTMTFPTLILIAFAAYYPLVTKSEEKKLAQLHGANFAHYQASVSRFFPDPSGFTEPETYTVKPRIFRRHLTEVIWFLVILGFVGFVKALHREQILPTLFHLY